MARMLADKALSLGISPLRPYSLAQAIKEYPGPYYNSLEKITGHGGNPSEFVNYILDIHEGEVRKFQARAILLSRINLIPDLSRLERELLREISRDPQKNWKSYEAAGTLDLSPADIDVAWKNLEQRKILENGILNLTQASKDQKPAEIPEKADTQSYSPLIP